MEKKLAAWRRGSPFIVVDGVVRSQPGGGGGAPAWQHASHGGEGPSHDRQAADTDPEPVGVGRRRCSTWHG
jgi:hypothetical protein